jgi:ATPase family associated with various cellular activities (AAA)/Ankyrin repeats (3 copies)
MPHPCPPLTSLTQDPSFPEEAARLNERGNLPLHAACSFQATADVVEVLLKAYPGGASQPNSAGNLPIHQAAMWQAPLESVQLLLSRYPEGATVRNQYGSLPLHMAASNQASVDVVRLLIDSYPDALHLQNDDGMTPLDLALADETVSEATLALLEGRPPPPELTRRQQAERFEERAQALERKLATLRDSGGRQDNDLRLALAAVRRLADRFPHALYAAKMDPNELEIAFSTASNETAENILLEAVKKRGEVAPRDRVEDLLSSVVGLEHIKAHVRGLRRTAEISDLKESLMPYGRSSQRPLLIPPALAEDTGRPSAPHMVFCGNPGTGKTAVARLLAKAFHELGLLRKPKFLEVERMDLVARDPETTVMKTREVLEEARGGILLIDEAHNLGLSSKRKGGGGDSGIDAISEIVSGIDSRQEDFPLIILSGFPLDMRAFLAFQPELRKRVPLVLEFPDYSCQELAKIFVDLATAKGFDLDDSLTPSQIALMLEQETTPAWRSERNGRVTEMLLAGVRTEVRKRMRRAQLEEQDDFDPHLIVREDVENVMRVDFK